MVKHLRKADSFQTMLNIFIGIANISTFKVYYLCIPCHFVVAFHLAVVDFFSNFFRTVSCTFEIFVFCLLVFPIIFLVYGTVHRLS